MKVVKIIISHVTRCLTSYKEMDIKGLFGLLQCKFLLLKMVSMKVKVNS